MVFSAACTSPTRVSGPAVSDQSFSPAAAVGTAATTPAVTSRSAAPSAAGPPAASGGADITHAPIGRSVSIGGRGCPRSVPLSRLRTTRGRTARPTAPASGLATLSSASSGSGRRAACCKMFMKPPG